MNEPDRELHRRLFAEVVQRRRSVRGFLPEPVPQSLLGEVFALAQTAPSNCNTQPWFTYVVSGERRRRLSRRLLAAAAGEPQTPDVPWDSRLYTGVYKERQRDSAWRLYEAMGVAREDGPARAAAARRNFEFFDAPHVAFICAAAFAGAREMADVGMYAQNLMLALAAYGIASVPQTALGLYAAPVKQELGIDPALKLLIGVSFGYEDAAHAANRARIPRAGLDEAVVFLE